MNKRGHIAGCIVAWAVLSLAASLAFVSRAVHLAEEAFASRANRYAEQVAQRLLTNDAVLENYAAFVTLDSEATQSEERTFIRQLLYRHPHIEAMLRLDRVRQGELAAYETGVRLRDDPTFAVRGYDLDHQRYFEPLPEKPDYFPVVLVEPPTASALRLLGVDVSFNSRWRDALLTTVQAGRPAASPPFPLGAQRGPAYLLVRAVTFPREEAVGPSVRARHLVGMLVRADFFGQLLPPLPRGLQVDVRLQAHQSGGDQPVPLLRRGSSQGSLVEELLFPRLEWQRTLGGDAQPVELRFVQQLGWSAIGPSEWAGMTVSAVAAFFLVAYVRRRYRHHQDTLRARENWLTYLAHHDRLTGLPNRNLFYDRLQHAISRLRRSEQRLAVLFLDLDRFKPVNDLYGHAAGDRVLQLLAARLEGAVREADTVARLGGDEFVVLVEDVDHQYEVDQLIARLKGLIEAPYEFDGMAVRIGVSIGLAYYPEDGLLIDELLAAADRSMYGKKQHRPFPDALLASEDEAPEDVDHKTGHDRQ